MELSVVVCSCSRAAGRRDRGSNHPSDGAVQPFLAPVASGVELSGSRYVTRSLIVPRLDERRGREMSVLILRVCMLMLDVLLGLFL